MIIINVGTIMNSNFQVILNRVAHAGWASRRTEFLESFRYSQLESKKWLVFEILKFQKTFQRVAVLGSWNSILLYELLSHNADVKHWDFYDLDQGSHFDRDMYFKENSMIPNYTSIEADVTEIFEDPVLCSDYDLIINPSCEHMKDIKAQEGPLYALTSSDMQIREHINTVQHEEDLAIKCGIENVLYKGSLRIRQDHTRFCVVGYAK